MTSTEVPSRPLRRDAARNRELLLEAGREVFAARGLDATLDDVAHVAGVGVGTAYRHFPNKQALAAAIFSDDFAQLIAFANSALEIADPWQALVTFVESTVAKHAKDRGLYEVFVGQSDAPMQSESELTAEVASMREALTEPASILIERAKAAGCLRSDVTATDVAAVFLMMGQAYLVGEAAADPDVWRRYLWMLLDGLRATDRGPLPCSAVSMDELDRAFAIAKAKKHH